MNRESIKRHIANDPDLPCEAGGFGESDEVMRRDSDAMLLRTVTTEKVKHTGGPWRVSPDEPLVVEAYGKLTMDGSEQKWIATICKHNVPSYERDANARLIAAAPEMLSALEQMLEAYAPNADWTRPDLLHSAVRCALAAIRRAKGE